MDLNFLKTSTVDTQLQTLQSQLGECGDIFSSLVNSQNQWQQTPQIILLTFKSIGQFMEKLDRKISHNVNSLSTTFSRLLSEKINKQDLDMRLATSLRNRETEKSQSIEFKLRKEDPLDLETIEEIKNIAYTAIEDKLQKLQYSPSRSSPGKEQYHNILEITELFNKELSKLKDSVKVCEVKLMNQAISSPEKRLNQQLVNVKNQLLEIQKNMDRKLTERVIEISESNERHQRSYEERVENQRENRLEYVLSEMETLRRMMEEILRTKMERKEFVDFKGKVNKELGEKIKLLEVQEIIQSIQSQLQNRIQDVKSEAKKVEKAIAKQTKAEIEDLRRGVEKIGEIRYQSNGEKSHSSLKEIKLSLGKIERRISDRMLDTKEDIPEMKEEVSQELKRFWKKVEEELELRDQKLCETIQESKDTLRTEYRTTRNKAKEVQSTKDYEKLVSTLGNQLLLGKWISTRVSNNKYCLWEKQLCNTFSQNFLWESNEESLTLVAAGVYRIQFGFFSPTGSLPSIYINNQVAVKILPTKQKEIPKHPNGFLNGVTMIELILVPPRTKLSIQMSKQEHGESFLSIHKL